jgi:hypothetical protein
VDVLVLFVGTRAIRGQDTVLAMAVDGKGRKRVVGAWDGHTADRSLARVVVQGLPTFCAGSIYIPDHTLPQGVSGPVDAAASDSSRQHPLDRHGRLCFMSLRLAEVGSDIVLQPAGPPATALFAP